MSHSFPASELSESILPRSKRPQLPQGPERTSVKRNRRTYQPPNLKAVVKRFIPPRNKYQYKELASEDEIRLLILHGGENEDPILCTLVVENLKDRVQPYAALSYYWGDDSATEEIKIQSIFSQSDSFYEVVQAMRQPQPFYIRPNLYAALRHFRPAKGSIALWVDALCIDQENREEKNQQVSKMALIYNTASQVCVWLGKGGPQSDMALQFVPKILDLSNFDSFIRDPSAAPKWNALAELMRNRWFTRRWVVQEIALARLAWLHCGDSAVHWDDFADAVALFVTKLDSIKKLFHSSREFGYSTNSLGDVSALGASVLVEAISNLFRKSDVGDIQARLSSLETLVSKLLVFEASEPKDIIYALLSIARDTPAGFEMSLSQPSRETCDIPFTLAPNYNKSTLDVYKTFVDFCIRSSKSLDIICRHWAPTRISTDLEHQPGLDAAHREQLPSWIGRLSESPFGSPEDALNGRVNADSLVGRSDRKCYNAANKTEAVASFGKLGGGLDEEVHRDALQDLDTKSDGTLYVTGFPVDVVARLSAVLPEGIILQECLEMGGWDESHGESPDKVPERLWRTLVADRGPNGENPPGWYHRACLHCFSYRSNNGNLNTGVLIERAKPAMVVEFLKRVQSVVWNRKFLLSQDRGRFGLAPAATEEGDMICILYGCSVPVILRRHGTDVDPYFELIGEAYVHGLMDGEGINGRSEADATQFKLC